MSVLQGFLQPSPSEEIVEVFISDRFKDEEGNTLKFKIHAIPQELNEQLSKRHTKRVKDKGQFLQNFDNIGYQKSLVIESCIEPNFREKEICDYYKCIDPADVPGRMLSAGEYAKLLNAIMEVNGMDDTIEIEDEVKNS